MAESPGGNSPTDAAAAAAAVAAATEEGRLPPPRVQVPQKDKQQERLTQYRKSFVAPAAEEKSKDSSNSTSNVFRRLKIGGKRTHLDELDSLRCYQVAAVTGVAVAIAQLSVAVLTCPGSGTLASFLVAEISALFAIFATLPLLIPELRSHALAASVSLESYVALHACCAMLSILYFLEGAAKLGFVALGFAGAAGLFFSLVG